MYNDLKNLWNWLDIMAEQNRKIVLAKEVQSLLWRSYFHWLVLLSSFLLHYLYTLFIYVFCSTVFTLITPCRFKFTLKTLKCQGIKIVWNITENSIMFHVVVANQYILWQMLIFYKIICPNNYNTFLTSPFGVSRPSHISLLLLYSSHTCL